MNEKKLLYIKKGRKYEPIAEHLRTDYFSFGNYLLHVCKGGRSFKLIIDPEYAKVLSALYEYRDEACKVLMEGLKVRRGDVKIKLTMGEVTIKKATGDVKSNVLNYLKEKGTK